jgi:hypothetical protein
MCRPRSGQVSRPLEVDVSYSELFLIFVTALTNHLKYLNDAYPGFPCGQGKATDEAQ